MRATAVIIASMLATSAQAGVCRLERLAYAPGENLEAIDVALIGRARKSIDFAAYVLTSIPIVEALDAAAARGVNIRIYRDGADVRMPAALAEPYDRLVARQNVEARYKGSPQPFMHLKAYAIDGALPAELVDLEKAENGGGRIRLTEKGQTVMDYIATHKKENASE